MDESMRVAMSECFIEDRQVTLLGTLHAEGCRFNHSIREFCRCVREVYFNAANK